MAVDVYVMPIWRFKVGDFESPLERLAPASQVHYVTPQGIFTRLDPRAWLTRWRAKREVRSIQREVSAANGFPVSWVDEGACVYSAQLHTTDEFKSYIWWLERRELLGEFRAPKAGDSSAAAFWQTAPDRPTAFPHLSKNGMYSDYFLPAEFERVVEVEPEKLGGWFPVTKAVSSTPRALREIHVLNQHLRVEPDYKWQEGDPLALVKVTFNFVRNFLELSHKHRLPVIFWG